MKIGIVRMYCFILPLKKTILMVLKKLHNLLLKSLPLDQPARIYLEGIRILVARIPKKKNEALLAEKRLGNTEKNGKFCIDRK